MVKKAQTLLRNSKSARWLVLIFIAVTMYAAYFFAEVFPPISPFLRDSLLGWTDSEYGSYSGAYSLLCVWGGLIVCGALLDKWGTRVTGTIFVTSMVAGALIVYYAVSTGFNTGNGAIYNTLLSWFPKSKPSVILSIAGYSIFGLGAEIAGVAVTKSIAKWFRGKEVATAMSLQVSLARVGTASAYWIIPFLLPKEALSVSLTFGQISWPVQFAIFLLLVGLITFLVFCVLDKRLDTQEAYQAAKDPEDEFKFSDVWRIMTNKHFIMIALLCVFFYCCVFSFDKFAIMMLSDKFKISTDVASYMMSLLPFGAMLFTPIFGTILDFRGKGTKLMILGSFIVLFVHLLFAFGPEKPFIGFAAITILGVGFSLVPAAMWPTLPKIIPQSKLGTAIALTYWVQNIGLWGVPIIAGKVLQATDRNYLYFEFIYISLAIVAIFVSIILSKSDPQGKYGLDLPNKKKG
ncbi:MAG: MFS transporter [Prevotellaceae bacterium]|jgi:MFS family permease|nr:MFS transporter [Prevotellaceae bacterium]